METNEIKRIGGFSFAQVQEGTYALAYSSDSSMSQYLKLSHFSSWEYQATSIAGERMAAWGANNNLPADIRNMLEKNNLGPGILDRKRGLHYGQSAHLYSLKYENNEIIQQWIEDKEIQAWLDTWDYKEFLRESFNEIFYLNGVFVKYTMGQGVRINRPWVAKLECEISNDCRLQWVDSRRKKDVQFIYVGDFENLRGQFKKYPVFDKSNPTAAEVAMYYHNLRSYGRYFYSLSSFHGAIPWVQRANDIPEIIKYLTENMIAAAYHIHEPAAYWDDKMRMISEAHPEWDESRKQKELALKQDQLTKIISNVLSGKRNAGKFFESIDFHDQDGNLCAWKIEPIEMNIDKYIKAQSEISKIADSSTTSGFGLSPSLSNIIINGKGDSGSQMLYALKIFYAADTQIMEEIVMDAINNAIRINFPQKQNIYMGIYRKTVNAEANVTASARTTNNM